MDSNDYPVPECLSPENTDHWGKAVHCTAVLQLNNTGTDQTRKYVDIFM